MTGIVPKYQGGPVTYKVSAKVPGGKVVAADTGAETVSVAGADSPAVLGVSLVDAIPASEVTAIADDFGNSITPMHGFPEHTTVAQAPFTVPVTFAADTDFGAFVKSAANGEVTPWVSGTDDASLIIGKCVTPGGVDVSAAATGLVRLGL